MKPDRILVVGAGLGGLTAALAALRGGQRVAVLEQSPELGEVGAGIMVTPNVTKVLASLGLAAELERIATEPLATHYRRFDTGETMTRAPLTGKMLQAYGARSFNAHRADLHAMLVAAIRAIDPGAIRLGRRLTALEQHGDGVVARFADGSEERGELLVGADGIRSTVRALTFGRQDPTFTGQVAWRGLVPTQGLPADLAEPVTKVWVGERRHIIHYPLRNGTVVNYVAIVATESWAEEGWNTRSAVSDVVAQFAGWHRDIVQLLEATDPDHCIKWGLFGREPLGTWSAGRVTLLGDAAHPMLPFMAQGAAMAIEDGLLLARAVGAGASIEDALRRYGAVRVQRANWVVAQSTAATRLYQQTGGNKEEERARNLDTLYGYDATTVAV